jgi:predicted aspartyl protease
VPFLHLQLQGEIAGPDGKKHALPPQVALQLRGPAVQVALHFPAVVAQELTNRGESLPNPVVGEALIDTGASFSCIDVEAARDLGLSQIDVAIMHSASHADQEMPVYFAAIELLGMGARLEQRVMGASLKALGLVALIGRDALATWVLFYNGPTGQVTVIQP